MLQGPMLMAFLLHLQCPLQYAMDSTASSRILALPAQGGRGLCSLLVPSLSLWGNLAGKPSSPGSEMGSFKAKDQELLCIVFLKCFLVKINKNLEVHLLLACLKIYQGGICKKQ